MKTLYKILVLQLVMLMFTTACKKDEVNENFPLANQAPGTPLLSAPTDDEENVELTEVELKWQRSRDPDGDEVSYDVYLGQQNPPQTLVAWSLVEANYIIDETLAPNTTYFWQVLANDGHGNESKSGAAAFRTRPPNNAELLIGKWQLESGKDNNGEPLELSDCEKQTTYEFSNDGIFIIKDIRDNSQTDECDSYVVALGYSLLNSTIIQYFIENKPEGDIGQIELIAISETELIVGLGLGPAGDDNGTFTKIP